MLLVFAHRIAEVLIWRPREKCVMCPPALGCAIPRIWQYSPETPHSLAKPEQLAKKRCLLLCNWVWPRDNYGSDLKWCMPLLPKVSKISLPLWLELSPVCLLILFYHAVKNRLSELIVTDSLKFLHRNKVCFLTICLMQDNICQHLGNSCSFWGWWNRFSGRTLFPGNGLTDEDSLWPDENSNIQPSLGVPTVCFIS